MEQVTIKNSYAELTVLNYGAIIKELLVKNKKGERQNIVVGLDPIEDYYKDEIFLGACVGRFAGRITQGGFTINGHRYELDNINGIHLHGGKRGFGKRHWKIETIGEGEEPFVKLVYFSSHMEEGYPGNLKAMVTYRLIKNSLHIIHEAYTDETTVINLTNHSYFQLDDSGDISHHIMKLKCSEILETDVNTAPTGKILSVNNTIYDFKEERSIKDKGIDTPFICPKLDEPIASIYSTISGIRMQVKTNQPAVVIYTPPQLAAICFETQNFPDAPNQSNFPSALLNPGETYINEAQFIFDLVP